MNRSFVRLPDFDQKQPYCKHNQKRRIKTVLILVSIMKVSVQAALGQATHTHTHKLRKNAGNQLDCQTGNHKAASLIAKLCGQFNSDLRSPLLSLSTFYLLKFLRRMLNKHFSVGNLIGEDMNTDPKTVTRFSTAVPRGQDQFRA